jgi:outer membrane protein OmpA-like peptidoglycan-associated protein
MTNPKLNKLYLAGVCSVVAYMAGCASTPPEGPSALARARAAVQQLEAEPLAAQVAARPLEDARDALSAAESAEHAGRPVDVVIHLSYLAQRDAEVGEAMIAEESARVAMTQAQGQRDQVLLQAREREVAVAREQTAEAQLSAQQAQEQAQASQQVAQDAQQQAQVSQQAAQDAQQQAIDARDQLVSLQAQQTDRGMVLSLSNVVFDSGSNTLKSGAGEVIARLSQFLQNHPSVMVRIEGHTDGFGSDSHNEALSLRRAETVAVALENNGVAPGRIEVLGRGSSAPIAGNNTGAGRQLNRRVEIIFSDWQGQFVGG